MVFCKHELDIGSKLATAIQKKRLGILDIDKVYNFQLRVERFK